MSPAGWALFGPRTIALVMVLCATAGAEEPDLAEALYVRSGLEAQLAHTAELFAAGFLEDAERQRLPQRLLQSIETLARNAYSAQHFHDIVVPALESALPRRDMEALLDWLDTPSGRRLTDMERQAAAPGGEAVREAFERLLQDSPPSEHRVELIEALDLAAGITEATADSVINTSAAIAIAIASSSAYPSYEELMAIKEELAEQRAEVEAEVRGQVFLDLLFTYREASDEMLEYYVEFARSPLGRRYHETLNEALDEAYTRSSWRLGHSIATLLALEQSIET